MTDESRPDNLEDPKPDLDEQALVGTGNEKQDDLDTAHEMETIVPSTPEQLDSATIQGVERPQKPVVLDGEAIPGYELLGELGRGGMGVVYKARDQKLKRIVALKMILSGAHASDEDMQRFQIEAEAVAKLQHPNIVQIYEVAEHEGRPYIALEYADGGSLDQKIAGTPQNASESARLIETLARAIELAHQQEIIHRDLKPANILLTEEGEPKITDFGLAKRLDEDSSQTKSGAVMGTPSYMAPEQAASNAKTLGPAADTYALGAILYHMLTGRPPFQAETQLDTIMQVIGEEPIAPRRLNSTVPVDLETITLKCLQKDIGRRYDSAEALAEDLRRFAAREPIQARPVSLAERGWKWARRRPAIAGLIGVSMVALLILIVGGLWVNASLKREKDDAQRARQEAEASEAEATKGRREAESAREWISQSLARVMQDQPPNEAVPWLADDLRRETSSRRRRQAAQRLVSTIRASVKPSSIQFLESASVRQLKLSPRNGLFVTSMSNGDLHRFDLATGQPIGKPITNGAPVQQLEFDPVAKRMMGFMNVEGNALLVVPKKSLVRFWDLETGKREPLKIDLEGGWIRHLRYSPDGQTIMLVVDDRVELRNAGTGERVFPGLLHQDAVLHASWNLEGTRIMSVTEGAKVHHWNAGTGDPLGDPLQVSIAGDWKDVTFSADRQLAVLIGVRNAQLVTTSDGKRRGPLLEHEDKILFTGFSNDGQRLVTTSRDHTAQVWNTENGLALVSPFHHPGDVRQAAFDLSGELLATACADRYLRVWDIKRGEISGQPMVHRKGVNQVHFCGDGRRLLSASSQFTDKSLGGISDPDGTEIRLWDLANADQYSSLGVSTPTRHAFFVLRGNRILTVQDPVQQYSLESSERSPTLQLWDAASHENLFVASHPELPDSRPLHAYLDPSRRYLVTWSGATAWLWGMDTNQVTLINELSHESDRGLESGNEIAGVYVPGREGANVSDNAGAGAGAVGESALFTFTAGSDVLGYVWPGKYKLWDLKNGQFVDIDATHFTGKYLVSDGLQPYFLTTPNPLTTSQEMQIYFLNEESLDSRVFDFFKVTKKICFAPRLHPVAAAFYVTTFSLSTNEWGMTRIGTGNMLITKDDITELEIGHRERFGWRFDRAGRRILTFSEDKTARVWDAKSGNPLTLPLRHNHALVDGAFSPDGTLVVTAASGSGEEGELRIWETSSGIPRSYYFSHGKPVEHVQFDAQGKQVMSVGGGEVRLWNVELPQLPDEDLLALSELVSGWRVENLSLFDSDMETVQQAWEKFGQSPEWGFQPAESQLKAWYLDRFQYAQEQKEWSQLLQYTDQALQRWPGWDKSLEYRSETHARQELWPEAAEDLAALVASGTHSPARWNSAAVTALVSGDHAGYLETCRRMLKEFGVEESSGWVPWTCVLDPEGTRLLLEEAPLALEAIELELEGNPFAEHVSAILLYRSGNWKGAATRLEMLLDGQEDAVAGDNSPGRNPRTAMDWHSWSFLAQARARLGDSAELAAFLERINILLSDPAEREKLDWKFRADLILHQREAKQLLSPAPSSATEREKEIAR